MQKYKYGVLIGRFQPMHLGHQAIINEMIADDVEPIIVLGSAGKNDERNPFSFLERFEIIQSVYGNIPILSLEDYATDAEWMFNLRRLLLQTTENRLAQTVVYYHRKPQDCIDGLHPLDCLRDHFAVKEALYPTQLGITINATDIRANPHLHRHYLDGRVYRRLYGEII